MKKTKILKVLSLAVCIVLIAAIALCMTACDDNKTNSTVVNTTQTQPTKLGEGDTKFELTVTHKDGKETVFEIYTNETTVGEALLKQQLIAGENGDYGLYIKTVDGETLDFNTDGMYWAFYINGEYALTGIDTTGITDGDTYALKAEK